MTPKVSSNRKILVIAAVIVISTSAILLTWLLQPKPSTENNVPLVHLTPAPNSKPAILGTDSLTDNGLAYNQVLGFKKAINTFSLTGNHYKVIEVIPSSIQSGEHIPNNTHSFYNFTIRSDQAKLHTVSLEAWDLTSIHLIIRNNDSGQVEFDSGVIVDETPVE